MTLLLHNPVNRAHLEDLKDRLSAQLALAAPDPQCQPGVEAVIATLVEAVEGLDRGDVSEADARKIFGAFRIPGFRFEQWLAEMVEEGVYLETAWRTAA